MKRDNQQTQDAIVKATQCLMAEKRTNFSVEEVAKKAQVGIGTIYRRFPTKDDLITEVLTQHVDEVLQKLDQAGAEVDDWQAFEKMLFCMEEVFANFSVAVPSNQIRYKQYFEKRDLIDQKIKDILHRVKSKQLIREDLVLTDLYCIFITMNSPLMSQPELKHTARRRLVELVLQGCKPSEVEFSAPPLDRNEFSRLFRQSLDVN